ncbi:MAG TPA: type IV secretion system DNA-binding domain-containing protein [Candidatus Saccharimonadales bacterium]|nr:type IV secretion system DNA-binding domain-containing protein [Candidatus Saccharimonadales bacterium]
MLRRILDSRSFVAGLLAMTTGLVLFYRVPFPDEQVFLRVIAVRAPHALLSFKYLYWACLFSTPYMVYAGVFSVVYTFTLKLGRTVAPGRLPAYPDPHKRDELFLVLGEVHNPRKPGPSETPRWLTIPERGLFTGIAVFGAVGSGKTSSCLHPFAEQILSYEAINKDKRIGGLILEVKGDFCKRVKEILERSGRGEDYIEISLDSDYRYNPLHNDLDAYALAFSIATLLNNLFGRGKEPFWQQAYTNLVKFIILLYKLAYGYVTLFDVYHCAICPPLLEQRIHEAEQIILGRQLIALPPKLFGERIEDLAGLGFAHDPSEDRYVAPATPELRQLLRKRGIPHESRSLLDPSQADPEKLEQFAAVKRWHDEDWRRIEPKLRTSIVEGISVFLSLFDDNPKVKKVFCPKAECYDPQKNTANQYGRPLPSFSWLIEHGKVCALNFPIGMNPGLAKALGVMMKLDFERAVLNRVPEIEAHPERHFRQVLFLCDEYQHFATVGESDPTGDEKFFSLSRQPKCIPIVATQSISSLRSALPGDSWRTLLQTFRTKIFLSLSDDFSARTASELCGREDRLKVSYNLSESGHDARVSLLTGKALSHRANITASKSYNTQSDFRFDMKTFTELCNAQSVTIAYDGLNPMPPMFCYLKPYYNDPNKSYFEQLAEGAL